MRARSSIIVAAAALLPTATALIIPDFLKSFENLQDMTKRCENPCGWEGKLCCASDETCYTDQNDQAQCGTANSGAGAVSYITSTYVLVNSQTITTTIAVSAATSSTCKWSIGETSCGNTCCNSEQFCQSPENSKCQDTGSGSSGYYSSLLTVTTVITNTAEPPLRPTSNTLLTVTATGTAGGVVTTTQGFISPTSTIIAEQSNGGGGGLSGGAIAGIVIGVIAALIILILICLCCCAKGILDAILGIFGMGPRSKRKEKEVEIYESRHHHGSRRGRSVSAAPARRTWYGTKVKQGSDYSEKKKSNTFGRATGVAAFLAGLAVILGLKRSRDRKKDNKSDVSYGSSYYSYSSKSTPPQSRIQTNTISGSESSSDRNTRRGSRSRSRAYSQSRASRR